jgi:hypothetical protein
MNVRFQLKVAAAFYGCGGKSSPGSLDLTSQLLQVAGTIEVLEIIEIPQVANLFADPLQALAANDFEVYPIVRGRKTMENPGLDPHTAQPIGRRRKEGRKC